MRGARALAATAIAAAASTGCLPLISEPPPSVPNALYALADAGFEFEPDVQFRADRHASCDGFACADLVVIQERRTILLARDAFDSCDALRAALLEIWERYRDPQRGSTRDFARGALRVASDGSRVGIEEKAILRAAHHTYRQLFDQLPPAQRVDLPDPDTVSFP